MYLYIPLLGVQVKKSKMLEKHTSYTQNYLSTKNIYLIKDQLYVETQTLNRLVVNRDKPVNSELRLWIYGLGMTQIRVNNWTSL